MQPFARGYAANADVFSPQDLLSNHRHHDRMIHVVVGSITVRNILKCEPANEVHDAGIARFKDSVGLHVHFVKLIHETIDHHLRGVEHREILLLKISRALRWCTRRAATGEITSPLSRPEAKTQYPTNTVVPKEVSV